MCEDFVKERSFVAISRGLQSAIISDLLDFLRQNGFYPPMEKTDAILRRCDHDGNRAISYDEFCE